MQEREFSLPEQLASSEKGGALIGQLMSVLANPDLVRQLQEASPGVRHGVFDQMGVIKHLVEGSSDRDSKRGAEKRRAELLEHTRDENGWRVFIDKTMIGTISPKDRDYFNRLKTNLETYQDDSLAHLGLGDFGLYNILKKQGVETISALRTIMDSDDSNAFKITGIQRNTIRIALSRLDELKDRFPDPVLEE